MLKNGEGPFRDQKDKGKKKKEREIYSVLMVAERADKFVQSFLSSFRLFRLQQAYHFFCLGFKKASKLLKLSENHLFVKIRIY